MSDNVTHLFPERKKSSTRIITLILAFVVVIGAIVVVLSYESGHFDTLRRFFTYLCQDGENYYTYLPNSGSVYTEVDDELAIASVSDFAIYGAGDKLIGRIQVPLISPAVQAGKKVAMAYDIGGSTIVAMDHKNKQQMNIDTEGTLLDADISSGDQICYAVSTSGYKTVLVAINDSFQETYRWYSSSSFLSNCAISPKGDWMAAIAIGQNEHVYESKLLLFQTGTEEAPVEISLGNQLVYDLEITDRNQICVVSDVGATLLDRTGEVSATYPVENRYLADFDFGGSDFLTLAVNQYKAGNHYTLVTIPLNGGEIHETTLDQEIIDLDSSGSYVGVLTAEGLFVFRNDLTEYATMEQTGAASGILMREDGTVLLMGSDSAKLFIP